MDTNNQLRVLVAEDDPGCRAMTARVIRELGHAPTMAAGESDALRLFRAEEFNLVLSDLRMEQPDSGLRIASEVRRLRPGTPVILMTGRPGTDGAIPGLRAGACDYLVKPFRPAELSDSIRHALDMERATREELHAAYSQLAKVDRLREAMLAIVSHELRTPLCAAKMAAEILTSGMAKPDFDLSHGLLLKNLEKLRATIGEFMMHAKLAAGSVCAALRPEDLLAMVRREADAIKPLAEERAISVTLESTGPVRTTPLDADLASQAVRHLLMNAVRFNREGGSVQVAVAYEPELTLVSVTDDGPGISPTELGPVFDPFYQTADYLTRRVGGLGLGLAIVRLAMEAHGGSVHVSSAPEHGSRFSLVFPTLSAFPTRGSYVA